jgi:hypothetical protein
MILLITLNTGNIPYNDFTHSDYIYNTKYGWHYVTYNWPYLELILHITVNKKRICNVIISVISKVIISIVVVSSKK